MATLPSAPSISIFSYAISGYFSNYQPLESYDVTINWTHPTNGGSPITAYNMYINYSTSPIVINASSTSTIFPIFTILIMRIISQGIAHNEDVGKLIDVVILI